MLLNIFVEIKFYILHVFNVNFDKFNASLLDKSMNFFKEKLLNGSTSLETSKNKSIVLLDTISANAFILKHPVILIYRLKEEAGIVYLNTVCQIISLSDW